MITAPTISLPYSATTRTETVEVYVQDSDEQSPEVGADNVELGLPDTSNVFFTGAGATTANPFPYLFGSQAPGWCVADGGDMLLGSDFADGPTVPSLANGDGLLLVDLTIMGGTTGDFPLTFQPYGASDPVGTALFDQNNDLISSAVVNGSIDIAPVPEPSAALLALLGILGAGLAAVRRKRLGATRG
jgi:hypothetical protein